MLLTAGTPTRIDGRAERLLPCAPAPLQVPGIPGRWALVGPSAPRESQPQEPAGPTLRLRPPSGACRRRPRREGQAGRHRRVLPPSSVRGDPTVLPAVGERSLGAAALPQRGGARAAPAPAATCFRPVSSLTLFPIQRLYLETL